MKQNAEKTQIQVDGIQNEMRVRTEALEHRLDVYAGVALLFLTLLGWFGYKTVKGWARDRIEKMADEVFEEGLTDFKKRATEQVTGLIAEQTAKAEKQRREIEQQAQELFSKYGAKAVDRDKPEEGIDISELSDYLEKLAKTKTEDQYTVEDWFLSGYEAYERGDSEEAVTCYTNSIRLDQSETWSYINRGAALTVLNRHDDALEDYNKAIALDAKNSTAYMNRGNTLSRLGHHDEALMDYEKAIALDPKTVKVYNNRGSTLHKLGHFDEALNDYNKAIDLDPKYATAYSNRGSTLHQLGRYDEALKALDQALEIDPEYIRALANSVEVRILLGQYEDAMRQASKALSISGNSKDKATSLYLECIAEKLLGKDTSATEAEFDQILKEDFEVTWSFDEIEGWLEKADISEEASKFISAKTALLKAKTKKR